MKVILTENVKKLGEKGEVREVSDGYARNYLIPKGLAVEVSPGVMKDLAEKRAVKQIQKKREFEEAEQLCRQIEKQKLVLEARTGVEGKLFGSITSSDIAKQLEVLGVKVDKKKIELTEPIKALGSYKINIRLHPEVVATLSLEVVGV